MENNFYIEEISENIEKAFDKNKKLIILFSVLAAGVPLIIQSFITPAVLDFGYQRLYLDSSQMSAISTLTEFLVAAIKLILLVVGGYLVTRTKEGIIRFCGIFMFSSTVVSALFSVFSFISSLPVSEETASYIMLGIKVIMSAFSALINVKLFIKFEYRTENRYVTRGLLSAFRKKMLLFLVSVFLITLLGNVITAALASVAQAKEDMQLMTVILTIWAFASSMLILLSLYLLSKKVRNDKTDVIGFGASYYLSGVIISPVTTLVTGVSNMSVTGLADDIQLMITSISTGLLSIITTVLSILMMFAALKIFFSVKDEEVPQIAEDRAKQILRNLIESEKTDK